MPPPRLSLVMNDIKPHSLAQGVVMFAAMLELAEAMEAKGCLADSAGALGDTEDVELLKLGGRVLSVFASHLLPPEDAAWIKALMERAVASQGPKERCVLWMLHACRRAARHHFYQSPSLHPSMHMNSSSPGCTRTRRPGRL